MKYIMFKSKIFGDTKINLSEAIEGKTSLNEEVSETEMKKLFNTLYKDKLVDFKKEIADTVKKELNTKQREKEVEDIVSNCLVQLFKALWSRRSSWKTAIKNKSN